MIFTLCIFGDGRVESVAMPPHTNRLQLATLVTTGCLVMEGQPQCPVDVRRVLFDKVAEYEQVHVFIENGCTDFKPLRISAWMTECQNPRTALRVLLQVDRWLPRGGVIGGKPVNINMQQQVSRAISLAGIGGAL